MTLELFEAVIQENSRARARARAKESCLLVLGFWQGLCSYSGASKQNLSNKVSQAKGVLRIRHIAGHGAAGDSSQRWLTKDVTTISDPDWTSVLFGCVLKSEADAIHKGTQAFPGKVG